MMGSILSVNVSSSKKVWAFAECSIMTDDPLDSNPPCSKDSTLEESMWHIPSFWNSAEKNCLFLLWPLGGFFLAFQLRLLEFGFSLLVLHFCLSNSVVGNISQLSLTLSIPDILCKNKPSNIRIIVKANNRWVQNPYVVFFPFVK